MDNLNDEIVVNNAEVEEIATRPIVPETPIATSKEELFVYIPVAGVNEQGTVAISTNRDSCIQLDENNCIKIELLHLYNLLIGEGLATQDVATNDRCGILRVLSNAGLNIENGVLSVDTEQIATIELLERRLSEEVRKLNRIDTLSVNDEELPIDNGNVNIDLTGYATKEEVNRKANIGHSHNASYYPRAVADELFAEKRVELYVSNLDAKVEELDHRVSEKQNALVFDDYEQMVTFLNDTENTNLCVGQSIYIKTPDVPDAWISAIDEEFCENDYGSLGDDLAISEMLKLGDLKIGYCTLTGVETKLSLDEYVTGTQFDNFVYATNNELANKANTNHTHNDLKAYIDNHVHTEYAVNDRVNAMYGELDDKIADKANMQHDHIIQEIVGLETALAGKADETHSHTNYASNTLVNALQVEVNNVKQSLLDKADDVHTHPDLATKEELNTKADAGHKHQQYATFEDFDVLQNNLSNKADKNHTHDDYVNKTTVNSLQVDVNNVKQSLLDKADDVHTHPNYADINHTHNVATSDRDGFMSSADKTALDTIKEILNDDTDSDLVVNKISEVLKVFENYKEADNLAGVLAAKSNVGHVHNEYALEADVEAELRARSVVGHTHDNYATKTELATKLDKLTYEWQKSINFGSSGCLYLGQFKVYDSNITIDFSCTTSTTYSGKLVVATQNGMVRGYNVYGDPTNTLATSIYMKCDGIVSSRQTIHLYFVPSPWSKNIIQVCCSAIDQATNICENVASKPAEATDKPTNVLTTTFSNVNHTHDDRYATVNDLLDKANADHSHSEYADQKATVEALMGKANKDHSHTIEEVSSLQNTLNSKSDIGHTHEDYATKTSVSEKANLTHSHAIVDIENLQTELDNKVSSDDLADCIKKTDVASSSELGIVKPNSSYGTVVSTSGILRLQKASDANIKEKKQEYRPITPSGLDLAVKEGLANNALDWTDDEKTNARTKIGALDETTANTLYASKETEDLVKEKQFGLVFGSYNELVDNLNGMIEQSEIPYRVGQSIYIITLDVPDLWIKSTSEQYEEYSYTDDDAIINELDFNGTVHIGCFLIAKLETFKQDLTDYVKNTDFGGNSKAGIVKAYIAGGSSISSNGSIMLVKATDAEIAAKASNYKPIVPSNFQTALDNHIATDSKFGTVKVDSKYGVGVGNSTKKLFIQKASNTEISVKGQEYRPIVPANLDYAVKEGLVNNSLALTEEEKAKAREFLGIDTSNHIHSIVRTSETAQNTNRQILLCDNTEDANVLRNSSFTYNPSTKTLNVENISGKITNATNDSSGNKFETTYATKTELSNKADNNHKHSQYAMLEDLDLKSNVGHTHTGYSATNHSHDVATTSKAGFMSTEDKALVDTIKQILGDKEDADTIVNKIQEVLDVFENFPEGDKLMTVLSSKANSSHTHNISDITNLDYRLTNHEHDEYATNVRVDAALGNKAEKDHTHPEYANQNAFGSVVLSDGSIIQPDTKNDALSIVAGNNVTITGDMSTDKITISSKDTVYTHPTTTTVTPGLYKIGRDSKGHVVIGDAFTLDNAAIPDLEVKLYKHTLALDTDYGEALITVTNNRPRYEEPLDIVTSVLDRDSFKHVACWFTDMGMYRVVVDCETDGGAAYFTLDQGEMVYIQSLYDSCRTFNLATTIADGNEVTF